MTFDHNIVASTFFVLMMYHGVRSFLTFLARRTLAGQMLQECEGKNPDDPVPPDMMVALFRIELLGADMRRRFDFAYLYGACGLTALAAGYLGAIGGFTL